MKRIAFRLAWALTMPLLGACVGLSAPAERRAAADALAAEHGWHATAFPSGPFELVAYVPDRYPEEATLTVYIEGDGLAWLSPSTPSADPTPLQPVALELALAQPAGNAAYLARPCQYVGAAASGCPRRYWTDARFAAEVVDAMDKALDRLKARARARRLVLVGYSGGGAVAALLAERRNDIDRLVTVAGNLAPKAWTARHGVTPLSGSLDPADQADRLAGLPQRHFIGGKDGVIPPSLARGFPRPFIGRDGRNLHVIPAFDHHCCWVEAWPRLFALAGR